MKRIRVLAGKSMAHTSGEVLHTAAVMGYNTKSTETNERRERINRDREHTIK